MKELGKWSGDGIPPTRRKLHRLRAQRRREEQAAARLQRAFDAMLEKQTRKLKIDRMLVESDARSTVRERPLSGVESGTDASVSVNSRRHAERPASESEKETA